MDVLRLNEIQVFAYHGNKPEEKEKGQLFLISAEIRSDLRKACLTDNLKDTIDFDLVYKIVSETVKQTNYNLLEALGEEICLRILKVFPAVEVKLSIKKPDPPLDGKLNFVEVILNRNSQNFRLPESDNPS